jgi:hypothetical protein
VTGDTLSMAALLQAREILDRQEPKNLPYVCRGSEIRAIFGPEALNEIAVGETKVLRGWLVYRSD